MYCVKSVGSPTQITDLFAIDALANVDKGHAIVDSGAIIDDLTKRSRWRTMRQVVSQVVHYSISSSWCHECLIRPLCGAASSAASSRAQQYI